MGLDGAHECSTVAVPGPLFPVPLSGLISHSIAAMRKDWVAHHRRDGERLGWIVETGSGVTVRDLLGRERAVLGSWADAEDYLEELGLGYLAEPYELDGVGPDALRVRIVEVGEDAVVVKQEDFGAIDGPDRSFTLPFPAPDELRQRR